jgi:ribitol 2-dehydrogenase
MKQLDKVVFITGGSSGIGAASAVALAGAGARVALFARRAAALDEVVARIGEDNALAVAGDVTSSNDLEEAVAKTLKRFGRIDAVFANAGVFGRGSLADGDPGEWAKMIDINVMGVLRTVRAVLPHLIAQKSGHVVLTASIAGRVVFPASAVYGASKHFVYAIAKGLRKEVYPHGIGVCVISPGYTLNELWEKGEPDMEARRRESENGTALLSENIADAVLYALGQPPGVNVADLLVLPTRLDVPGY